MKLHVLLTKMLTFFYSTVRCVRNKAQQFATRLYEAMKGLGTDDNTLIRVCVSRSEIDMVQIKEQFKTMYDQDLGKFIAVSFIFKDIRFIL